MIGLVIYNTREAPTAGKEQSPFTVTYWKLYCNSLLCEWRCVCHKSDPKSAPLLSATDNNINNNYNTVDDCDDNESRTPPLKDLLSKPSFTHYVINSNNNTDDKKSNST